MNLENVDSTQYISKESNDRYTSSDMLQCTRGKQENRNAIERYVSEPFPGIKRALESHMEQISL